MNGRSRGQSEVLGTALLLGITVIAATGFGVVYFDAAIPDTDQPTADLTATVDGSTLEIAHEGGDSLRGSDLRLIVGVNGSEVSVGWGDGTLSGGDDRFERGETWRHTDGIYEFADVVSVTFVHDPSGTVLLREELHPGAEETRPTGYHPGAGAGGGGGPTANPPTAAFTYSPSSPDEGESVTFDAGPSTDNGTIDTYAWDFDDDGVTDATGETTTHTFPNDGTWTVTLTVTDDQGNTDSETKDIVVGNVVPDAEFTVDPNPSTAGDNVAFDASGSDAKGNGPLTYAWDFDDDGAFETSGESVQETYGSAGDYDVSLRVTDDDGDRDTETKTVTVQSAPNSGPTADIYANPTTVVTGESVTFDGGNSTDSDGSIQFYDWDFGDSSTGSGQSINHSYSSAGTHTVTLTVTDNDGATGTDTVQITVESEYDVGNPQDPGHAYIDKNDNFQYDAGTDQSLSNSDLEKGVKTKSDENLVVPSSVGTVDAGNGAVTYEAKDIRWATTLRNRNKITFDATGGDLVVDDATIENYDGGAGSGSVSLSATEKVSAVDTSVGSKSDISVSGGSIDVSKAGLNNYQGGSGSGKISVSATSGALGAAKASFDTKSNIDLDGQGVTLTDATLNNYQGGSGSGLISVNAAGTLDAEKASFDTKGNIDLDGQGVTLTDATLNNYQGGSGSGLISVDSSGALDAANADLDSKGDITLDALSITLSTANLNNYQGHSGSGGITIRATNGDGGDVSLVQATLDSGSSASAKAKSGGVVDVDGARFRNSASPLTVSQGDAINEDQVQEGTVNDGD